MTERERLLYELSLARSGEFPCVVVTESHLTAESALPDHRSRSSRRKPYRRTGLH
jgi:hypothetical protein